MDVSRGTKVYVYIGTKEMHQLSSTESSEMQKTEEYTPISLLEFLILQTE